MDERPLSGELLAPGLVAVDAVEAQVGGDGVFVGEDEGGVALLVHAEDLVPVDNDPLLAASTAWSACTAPRSRRSHSRASGHVTPRRCVRTSWRR